MKGDVHAQNDQEGSGDKPQVAKALEKTAKRSPLEDRSISKATHSFECDQSLSRIVTSQGMGVKI